MRNKTKIEHGINTNVMEHNKENNAPLETSTQDSTQSLNENDDRLNENIDSAENEISGSDNSSSETVVDKNLHENNAAETDSTLEDSSSKSNSFAYDVTKETILIEQSYSDGYFNSSLDKLYERYMNQKDNVTASDEQPTGCFDETKDNANNPSKFGKCNKKQIIIISTTMLCMVVAATAATVLTLNAFKHSPHHYHGQTVAEERAEVYQRAAVVSSSSVCTKIGTDILRRNGSAVDAAVAASFCLSVTSKHSTSIGGGGFMLVYARKNKTFDALDFSSTAPGKAKNNMFDKNVNDSKYGGKSIAVPGFVKGLYSAWQSYGKLPWKDLVQPAVNLTKQGMLIQVRSYEIANQMKSFLQEYPGLRKFLLSSNNEPYDPGHLLIDTALSKTLGIIRDKPDDFYSGELAVSVVKDISTVGGIVSLDDLAKYKVRHRDPVSDNINSLNLKTIGAPSGGAVVLEILNILKGYHFSPDDVDVKDLKRTATTYHRIIEAIKFAFAHRTKLGDPDFNKDDMKQLVENMADEGFGERYRQKIDDEETKDYTFYEPEYSLPSDGGTSHVNVLAPNGDAVSMTTTINSWFGSMHRSLDTGILYNNRMKDFSTIHDNFFNLTYSTINSIHGGKRPLSSISPIIMTNKKGDVKFVLGGAGGERIIPAVAQVIINKIWFGDELGEAIYRPRVFHNLFSDSVKVEKDAVIFKDDFLKEIKKRKHVISEANELEFSAVQGIYVDENGEVEAKSDYRKYGHTDGF